MDKKQIEDRLLEWDGKHTNYLKNIYQTNMHAASFIQNIIAIYASNDATENATTWLIKHFCDKGEILDNEQIGRIFQKIGKLKHWGSQLHLLQTIPQLNLSKPLITPIEPFLKKSLSSNRTFVRAAAFEAYFEVIKFFPELKNEFKLTCEDALEKESASVQVKLKRILKKIQ